MLEHIFKKLRQLKRVPAMESAVNPWDTPQKKKSIEADIDKLYVCSRKGLWALAIFLLASIIAYQCRDLTLTGCLSASFREQLGPAPPEILVDALQVVSTFSSLILISGRIYDRRTPGNTWMHLGFRLIFYPLYFVCDLLGPHFDFVFVSGLVVLALQHYNIWNYAQRAIEKKMSLWDQLRACNREVTEK